MKFILSIGLLVIAILTLSFADEHEHEHSQHDDNSHPCAQPKYVLAKGVVGCFAEIPRWYHNHQTGKCEPLNYDGCNKNANNFETKEECEKTCDEWHQAHKDHHYHGHEDCKHDGHDGHDGHDHSHDHSHNHSHDQHQGHDHSHHHH